MSRKKRFVYIVFFFLSGIAVGFSACSDSEESVGELELILTQPKVAATDIAQFADIRCSGDWTITFEYPEGVTAWCESNRVKGNGDEQIVLQYSRNALQDARTAGIRLTAGDRSVIVTLTQLGSNGNGGNEGGGEEEDVPNPGWLELPKLTSDGSCRFVTHYVKMKTKNVRNFSLLFDTDERIAYWVAYPHCKAYLGDQKRSDAFQPDPKLDEDDQMSSTLPGNNYAYNRGHQIPSGDRTANAEMNIQTFYYSNMTPQLGSFNQKIWVDMETKVRNWLNSCDTLYVVTGAVLKTVGGNETVKYTTDKNGRRIAIPNYYFKVLLKLQLNNGNPNYQAIGFWFDHKANSGTVTSSYARTVDYIEEKTGFDFFSNLSEHIQTQVESKFEPDKWGIN